MELKPPIERTERLTSAGEIIIGSAPEANQANLRTLGRYQIQEELGRGAMGAVYKAYDPVIARTVALKTILINSHAPDRSAMVERLKQEAKAAGGLDHPNIITIYDVGEENGAVYLSMQFVQGITLAKVLDDAGVPSLETLLSWADQILAAVGFAHARGVIHRDLKPANLMVTEQGAIKVLDFGIAKIENTSLTQTGLVVGTPSYMSPEQIAGKKVDHRADIFSLGAVFYELLTREKPFAGDIATILYKIVNEEPVAPSLINPAIPGGIDAVVRKALAKDPKDRFQSCEQMRNAFLQPSVRAAAKPANVPAKKAITDQPTIVAARRSLELEKAPASIWSRMMIALALLLLAAAGWAFYVRAGTGRFPPVLAKFKNDCEQAISLVAGKLSRYSNQDQHHDAEAQSGQLAQPQNAVASEAPATTTQTTLTTPAAPNTSEPTSGSATVPSASAPTNAAESSGDHAASDGTSTAGAPASLPLAETSQKSIGTSQSPSAQLAEPKPETTQPAGDNAAARDADGAPSTAVDDKQSAPSAVSKPSPRKRAQDRPLTVDGFSRQDVPDLLRQAESSSARGNYRLARYEYGLVLKLEPNNLQAREGLRRLMVDWPTR